MLNQFLESHKIDVDALARMKHRLFVVGRFNVRKEKGTQIFLFTNRRDAGDAYSPSCFDDIKGLSYESFVECLKPAIAERVIPGDIPMIEQVIPTGDSAEESTSTIDAYNYFLWRATANPAQPAFRPAETGAVKDLLLESDQQPGKGIFKIVRKNLNTFCSFQPAVPAIVEAISQLLGTCGKENGMPAYAAGGALPGGFPERLIDFLFAENTQAPFTLDGLDLSGSPWSELARDDAAKSREMFAKVVTAFRDALMDTKFDQFAQVKFRGRPLRQQAKAVLKPEFVSEFARARDAFNGLRQILRSKVLLSMVLEWVFKSYYELEPVKQIADGDAESKDVRVRELILREYAEHGIAPAVKRASPQERKRFSAALSDNFERLLLSIVSDKEDSRLAELPEELRKLALELRGDADRRRMLIGISGTEFGSDYQKAFIEASKTILLDVLCPTLYQAPVLSVQLLRGIFKRETMEAYLTAVFLDDKHQDVVRQIADEHLDFFLKNIDPESKRIMNAGAVQERMLRSYLEVLAKPDVVRRLTEELEVLREMHTLLENTPVKEGQEAGPGRISALRDSAEGKRPALERTPVPSAKVEEPVRHMAQEQVEKEIVRIQEMAGLASAREAATGGAPPTPAAAGASSSREGTGAGAEGVATQSTGDQLQSGQTVDDGLTEQVKAVAERILAAADQAERKKPQELVVKVTRELLKDEAFVERAKKDVQVFEKVLHLIYRRYADNADKKTFRNKVERMTLVNLMLLFQRELGLGKMCSNLYAMLLDMVQHIDPENPDARAFIEKMSLTKYFDDAVLEGNGITNLRETLEAQAHKNLQNTVNFVSELRGIKYLLDSVKADSRAEVVVVNATAQEFLDWLKEDNLAPNTGQARLLAGKLTYQDGRSKSTIPPGLVYLTDAAFEGEAQNKVAWLENLSTSQFSLRRENAAIVLPPLCLSTGHQNDNWQAVGTQLRDAATNVPAPVVVVGPSPFMNRKGDIFQTYLPAGYVFAAHFLSRPDQGVNNEQLIGKSSGRFRVIGSSVVSMRESLERALWGEGAADGYAFAVDFYLYIVLTLLATARARNERGDASDFWPAFYWTEDKLAQRQVWQSSGAIDRALLGESSWFAMEQDLARRVDAKGPDAGGKQDDGDGRVDLTSVALRLKEDGKGKRVVSDVGWFNAARRAAELP